MALPTLFEGVAWLAFKEAGREIAQGDEMRRMQIL